jgi:hypothetical protein
MGIYFPIEENRRDVMYVASRLNLDGLFYRQVNSYAFFDEGNNPHLSPALWTLERVNLVHAFNQRGPS